MRKEFWFEKNRGRIHVVVLYVEGRGKNNVG
jgi:hypothetical protein